MSPSAAWTSAASARHGTALSVGTPEPLASLPALQEVVERLLQAALGDTQPATRDQKSSHIGLARRARIGTLLQHVLCRLERVALDQHPDHLADRVDPVDPLRALQRPARVRLRVGQRATVA